MREVWPTYTGYKRVAVPMLFIDNGDGAGYLRLQFPDGTYCKIFPLGEQETLHDAMQEALNTNLTTRQEMQRLLESLTEEEQDALYWILETEGGT